MSLWDLTAAELLARAASGDPTPGGGSVSAVSGALGLALVQMALEVTARHRDVSAGVPLLLARTRALLERLQPHPDADVAAFEGYMAALGRPKADDAQKAARRQAIQAAGLAATEAPLAAARDLLEALHLAEQAATVAHHNVVSDVGAGTHLLGAALQATLLNVDINLGSLPEEARPAALNERQTLSVAGRQLTHRVTGLVTDRLQR